MAAAHGWALGGEEAVEQRAQGNVRDRGAGAVLPGALQVGHRAAVAIHLGEQQREAAAFMVRQAVHPARQILAEIAGLLPGPAHGGLGLLPGGEQRAAALAARQAGREIGLPA